MPDTAPPTDVAHLRLLNCARGHFWEAPVGADGGVRDMTCPTCGAPADVLPLLDLEAADVPLPPPAPTPIPPPYQDRAGKPVVAGYEILEDLGRSTGGVFLYRAKQIVINRPVVLKTILARDDPSQHGWGALRGEAAALAKLPHPNIVGIFDAGDRDRQLFYNAVELVEGPSLTKLIAEKPLPVPQALALVEVLARAVHFAHEKGVVHRGLRPETVLLHVQRSDKKTTETPEPPACSVHNVLCIPRITGFGLAKARLVEGDVTDQELQDRFPCYLSPEQAWGRSKEIGPATDVYALGAILYECLTGQPPFRGSSPGTTLEQIQTIDALPIAHLRKGGVPADVEAVVRRCLHKQPRRRYASARELSDDLRRAAEGRPTQAREAGFLVRSRQWARRKPWAFVALCASVLGLAGILWVWKSGNTRTDAARSEKVQAEKDRARLKAELDGTNGMLRWETARTELAEYGRDLARAELFLERRDLQGAASRLDAIPGSRRSLEWFLVRGRLAGGQRRELGQLGWPVTSLAWSPDSRHLAASAGDSNNFGGFGVRGEVRAWSVADAKEWPQLSGQFKPPVQVVQPVHQVAFSPDGERLYWLNADGLVAWDRMARNIAFVNNNVPVGQASHFCCPADGRTVLVTSRIGSVYSLDSRSARFFSQLVAPGFGDANAAAPIVPLNADGSHYAWINPADGQRVIVVKQTDSRRLPPESAACVLASHPASRTVASGSLQGDIDLWVAAPGEGGQSRSVQRARPGAGAVTALALTPDGKRLVTHVDGEGSVRIWDVGTGVEVYAVTGFGRVTALAVSPDGARLAVASDQCVFVFGTER
jgi:serine/threonine protein kinase